MVSFLTLNNKYLLDRQKSLKPRDPIVFWPSEARAIVNGELYGSCMRQLYWKIRGIPMTNRMRVQTSRVCLMGKGFEDQEQKLTLENPMFDEIVGNYKLKGDIAPGITVSSEMDAIVTANKDYGGETRIVEYKTGSGYWYKKDVFPNLYSAGWPKDNYLLQTMLYLKLCKHTKDLNHLKTVEIFCLDREDSDTCSHEIELSADESVIVNGQIFEPLKISNIVEQFQLLKKYVEKKELPAADMRPKIDLETCRQEMIAKKLSKKKYEEFRKQGYGHHPLCPYCSYYNRCLYEEGHLEEFKEIA